MKQPNHYKSKSGIEPIHLIEAFKLDFAEGSIVKYICRARKKGERLRDYEKALYYIELLIAREKNEATD